VPRSGTTLLVNMLGTHPLLAPIYETRFLRNLLVLCERLCWFNGDSLSRSCSRLLGESFIKRRMLDACENFRKKAIAFSYVPPVQRGNKQDYESFPFGKGYCIHYSLEELAAETDLWLAKVRSGHLAHEEVWRSARTYIERLFAIHCARMGRPHWINKTPGFLNHLDGLSTLFPQAKYLNMIRDGRDVAVSNLSLPWGPKTVREAARRWKKLIRMGQHSMETKRLKNVTLHYEEFVRSPREVLGTVYNFLELDGDIDRAAASMRVFGGRCGVWRTRFTAKDRAVFAKEAGDLLIALGYEDGYDWVHSRTSRAAKLNLGRENNEPR